MGRKSVAVFLSISLFIFLCASPSLGYVEPTRKILAKSSADMLGNPDLPDRPGYRAGKLTLHGAVSSGVTFDPNVYLSHDNEDSDIIFTENGSVGGEYSAWGHKLSLDYDETYYQYGRLDVNDHRDNRARGLLQLNFPEHRVTVNEVYRNYTELPGATNASRLKQDSNDLRIGVVHETDKFAYDLGYSFLLHNYYNDDPLFGPLTYKDRSSTAHVIDATYAYRFFTKAAVTFENDLGFSDYRSNNSPDYWFDDMLLGIKGEFFRKKLSASVQGGLRYQDFDGSTVMYNYRAATYIYRATLQYIANDHNIFDLGAERTVNDSTYQRITYYMSDFVGIGYTRILSKKLSCKVTGSFQKNGYPVETTEGSETDKRIDEAYAAGVAFRYDFKKWLSTEFGYEFKKSNSNFSAFGYEDNIAKIKITAGF